MNHTFDVCVYSNPRKRTSKYWHVGEIKSAFVSLRVKNIDSHFEGKAWLNTKTII
jgi:hypothetical protein